VGPFNVALIVVGGLFGVVVVLAITVPILLTILRTLGDGVHGASKLVSDAAESRALNRAREEQATWMDPSFQALVTPLHPIVSDLLREFAQENDLASDEVLLPGPRVGNIWYWKLLLPYGAVEVTPGFTIGPAFTTLTITYTGHPSTPFLTAPEELRAALQTQTRLPTTVNWNT